MSSRTLPNLPALEIAGKVNRILSTHNSLVITAPPGAGKSTVLPLTISEAFPDGKILMLEPRRLAARSIAERMAYLLGEKVGQTVGYRIRFDNCTSASTRIEVITERILTRMIIDDPTLDGVKCIIFDEFHERSLDSDLALALARESQKIIRDDLRIVIMSATIDAENICRELQAPLVESEGRMFPVTIRYSEQIPSQREIADAVVKQIREALRQNEGDILAFLPGEAEIRRCAELLGDKPQGADVFPLYGMLDNAQQRMAIEPSGAGKRKIVLATPIAETSLTIEGVRIVVDSGLCRRMKFNPQTSLNRLETEIISMDMARQRTGRAGRVAEGVCYRLWSKALESRMKDCRDPEILEADLSSTVLDIAAWGGNNINGLQWLTPPPPSHVRQAEELLKSLGAIDAEGRITGLGRKMATIPCHPRIAKMLLSADSDSRRSTAAEVAAMLESAHPTEEIIRQYRNLIHAKRSSGSKDPFEVGSLLASAYPERIAKSAGNGRYLMACGDYGFFEDANDPLTTYDWIVIASIGARNGADGKIFQASPVDVEELRPIAAHRRVVTWDSRRGGVVAQDEVRIGRLLLEAKPCTDVPREEIVGTICRAAAKEGLSMFSFSDAVENLQRRIAAVSGWHPEMALPDVSTSALLERASEWLPLYIGKASTIGELQKIDLCAVIWGMLDYAQQQETDRLAPSHITVPSGNRIRVEYRIGAEAPIVRVRLQECFGLLDTPVVDGGGRKVLMELLSPGFKPVQLTSDLRSFWSGTYFEVRKELRQRYPKHSWPEKPLEALPVKKH